MRVDTARHLAAQWMSEQGRFLPGFAGAFLHGSINWMDDADELPPGSDVDLLVVVDGPAPGVKPGKFLYHGMLLEVAFLPAEQVADAARILETPHLAGSFTLGRLLADPLGRLAPVQAQVAARYATRASVEQRCLQNEQKIRHFLQGIETGARFDQHLMSWLFGTAGTTHVILIAALRNPTVRKRYLAARGVLAERGMQDVYRQLLELLGCAAMSQSIVASHMPALAAAFDAASAAIVTPIAFQSDLSADARHIAIDSTHALIEAGNHHEAIFWMVATYCRCLHVFAADAPNLYDAHLPGLRTLAADLGIADRADMRRRAAEVVAFLPELRRITSRIIDSTPEITGAEP